MWFSRDRGEGEGGGGGGVRPDKSLLFSFFKRKCFLQDYYLSNL